MSTGTKKKSKAHPTTLRAKRDARLLKLILADPNRPLNEAMIEAGFSESTANKQSKRTVEKSSIKGPLLKAMDKVGITDEYLAQGLKDGLEAYKVVSAVLMPGAKGEGGEGMKDAGSATLDTVDVPDFMARKGYQDMAHKLRSDYPDPKLALGLDGESLPQGITINFVSAPKGEQ